MSSGKPDSHVAEKLPDGAFKRQPSTFRNWISADGSTGFPAQAGRYHLYVSLGCPWASRVLAVRQLKGLGAIIGVTVVDWFLPSTGWFFSNRAPKCTPDTVNGCKTLREVYELAEPGYGGRVTVPVLWDTERKTIVNNESSELIRMLNSEFNKFCGTADQAKLDLYPAELRDQIDEVNAWVYPEINNGVYQAGFAKSQEAYNVAVEKLFQALFKAEGILSKQRYLCGDRLTEADIRLFVTLVRFDKVYMSHFKCNKEMIKNMKNLWGFTRDIYQTDGVSETVDMEHIMNHYMVSQVHVNPTQIVAVGPDLDFLEPHGREKLSG